MSFEVSFSTIGFLLLFSSLWNFFISLASLASCLEKRHLCCFLSSSFVKRRFSRREHLLHISTIEESRKHSSKRHLFRTPPLAGAYLLLPPTQKMRAYFSAKTQSTTQGAETFLEKGWLMTFLYLIFFLVPRDNQIRILDLVLITTETLLSVKDTLWTDAIWSPLGFIARISVIWRGQVRKWESAPSQQR